MTAHSRFVSPPHRMHLLRRTAGLLAFLLVLTVILALTWWAYHPGLSGDFLFDDFGSLPTLGATGPVDNWATFWRYITSGGADPNGRPLTLLTFLIDARDWPASPYPFKVTNVILHLINGALLAWVLWKLGRVLAARGNIPPPLRGDPLPAEGGGKNSGVAASLPPSVRRAERMRTRAKRDEGMALLLASPRRYRGDPLRSEGGESCCCRIRAARNTTCMPDPAAKARVGMMALLE